MSKSVQVEKWELWLLQLQEDSEPAVVLRHGTAAMRAFPARDCRELVGRQVGADGRIYQTLLADVPELLLELARVFPLFDPREVVYSFWREPIDPTKQNGLDRAYAGVAVIETWACFGGASTIHCATACCAMDAEEIRRMLYEFRSQRRGSRERGTYEEWLLEFRNRFLVPQGAGGPAGTLAAEVK